MENLNNNKIISAQDLTEIFNTLAKSTIQTYLSSYKFNKFRATNIETPNSRFYVTKDFLDTFYTLLWNRNRLNEAKKLAQFFKEYNVNLIPFEEFIK